MVGSTTDDPTLDKISKTSPSCISAVCRMSSLITASPVSLTIPLRAVRPLPPPQDASISGSGGLLYNPRDRAISWDGRGVRL